MNATDSDESELDDNNDEIEFDRPNAAVNRSCCSGNTGKREALGSKLSQINFNQLVIPKAKRSNSQHAPIAQQQI
jgi:hypothetical protein